MGKSKKSQTAVPSASNTTEDKIDGKKVTNYSQISTDEIQATGNFPQIVTEGTDFKEGINISTEEIKVAEQSSHRKEPDMIDKEIKESEETTEKTMTIDKFMLELNSKTMAGNIYSTQYQDRPTYSTQKLTVEKKGEKDGNGSTVNIQETEKNPHKMELLDSGEALMKIRDVINRITGKAKDGSEMKHTNEMVNVCPRQNKSYEISFQDLQRELKIYLTSERSKPNKDMKKFRRVESSVKDLLKSLDLLSSEKEKEITVGNAKALEEIKASKEEEDEINDIIIEPQKLEGKEYDGSIDYIKVAGQTPQTQKKLEGKKKGNKGKEDIDRSKDYTIKDFHSDKEMLTPIQEIEDSMRKLNKNETIYSEKTEIFPVGDFQRGLKEFMTRQKSKLDEQVKKHGDMGSEIMLTKEQPDIFSLEKGSLTTISKTESHKENRVTTHLEDDEIEEAVTIAQLDEPNEIIIELGRNENIRFEFETNGDKHIFVGEKHYYSCLEDKQDHTFNFKDESIQVCFTGNQVFISTQNSEFHISVRKSNPVNLTDEATQTDTLP